MTLWHPKHRQEKDSMTEQRAAIYSRVSTASQAEEDKTSLSEQTADMEAYCERHGYEIVERYQDVGSGQKKDRAQFQRMLADARQGRFDTIVCWKSDRLSRGDVPRRRPNGGRRGPTRFGWKPSWTPST